MENAEGKEKGNQNRTHRGSIFPACLRPGPPVRDEILGCQTRVSNFIFSGSYG